ncbi:MAG: hypothetical protein ABSC94_30980 [Polyangiaceae bacterium]
MISLFVASVMTTVTPVTSIPSQLSGSWAVRYTVPAIESVPPWQLAQSSPGAMVGPSPPEYVFPLEH